VYAIPVSQDRVTTISFPGPISAIDAAQVTVESKTTGIVQIAHTKGSLSSRYGRWGAKKTTNINVRWNKKTYVLELTESDDHFCRSIFNICLKLGSGSAVSVAHRACSPSSTRPKPIRCYEAYHPEAWPRLSIADYEKDARVMDARTIPFKSWKPPVQPGGHPDIPGFVEEQNRPPAVCPKRIFVARGRPDLSAIH